MVGHRPRRSVVGDQESRPPGTSPMSTTPRIRRRRWSGMGALVGQILPRRINVTFSSRLLTKDVEISKQLTGSDYTHMRNEYGSSLFLAAPQHSMIPFLRKSRVQAVFYPICNDSNGIPMHPTTHFSPTRVFRISHCVSTRKIRNIRLRSSWIFPSSSHFLRL